jgi:hypothetical protein
VTIPTQRRVMSLRDDAIVARHEVPGTAPTPKSRPVGYGMIRAGVGTDWTWRASHEKFLWNRLRPIIPYPTGRYFRGKHSQALRAWLRSVLSLREADLPEV